MSRRRPPGELQFGSDSFLDVVANIVGILIILIVIAGLRVSQTPVFLPAAASPNPSDTLSLPAPSAVPDLPDSTDDETPPPQVIVLQPVEEPEPEPQPPPLPELVVPQELVDLTDRLEAEIAELKKNEALLAAKLKQSGQQQAALLDRQKTVKIQMAEKFDELAESKRRAAKVEADAELAKETLARLAKKVSELESASPNVEPLEHRVTPISRVVNGNEKHYRLEKNRVIEVPLEDLIGRFREQLERRKDWLVKTRQHQGQIGPIKGFNMQYLVRVDSLTDFGGARAGQGGYRISLARWEIRPEPETKGETDEIALRRGSQFYQSILGTSPDTTLTFWVYPDSYPIFRKLQKFAHEHGYSVAARPLPHGLHIAGSPDGSKSTSE